MANDSYPNQALHPGQPLSDDEDLSGTVIGRGTAAFLAGFFLIILVCVALLDTALSYLSAAAAGDASLRHPFIALLRHPPSPGSFTLPIHRQGESEVNPLHQAETAIVEESTLRGWAGPLYRECLYGLLRSGTHTVVIGDDGWLYYRPGIDYLCGRSVLAAEFPESNLESADPRSVIAAFARDCAVAGAQLIIVMVPDKAAIEFRHLGLPAPPPGSDYNNSSCDDLVRSLRAQGILVYVPNTDLRMVARRSATFLRQDSHWTPEGMDVVAKGVAAIASPSIIESRRWRLTEQVASSKGDLVAALRLPPGQTRFLPETVRIGMISDSVTGTGWTSQVGAPLLVLGDSFTNIYDDPALGWGVSAGLAAHLGYHLGCEVEVIAINGGGINETRNILAHRPTALLGRKVVVWEFAMRELMQSQWRMIPMARTPGTGTANLVIAKTKTTFHAVVTAISRIPPDDATLYPNSLTTLTVKVSAEMEAEQTTVVGEFLLALPCLRRHVPLPASRLHIGDSLMVTAIPWEAVPAEVMRTKRYDDSERYDLPLLFSEEWTITTPSR